MSWTRWHEGGWSALQRELLRLQRDLDVLSSRSPDAGSDAGVFPPVNLDDTGEHVELRAEIPGARAEDIDVQVARRVVTIRGSRRTEAPEGVAWHRRERAQGDFSRSVTLAEDVDAQGVQATYRDGVLTVRLPKAPEAKPRQVKVTT